MNMFTIFTRLHISRGLSYFWVYSQCCGSMSPIIHTTIRAGFFCYIFQSFFFFNYECILKWLSIRVMFLYSNIYIPHLLLKLSHNNMTKSGKNLTDCKWLKTWQNLCSLSIHERICGKSNSHLKFSCDCINLPNFE